jgi:hypothetical protein
MGNATLEAAIVGRQSYCMHLPLLTHTPYLLSIPQIHKDIV